MNERTTEQTEKLLAIARERYARAVEAEAEIRHQANIDLRFASGDQWDEKHRRIRESAGRPALTFNKLSGPIQQIANDARQNKPALKISPVDSAADKDTALVLQGIIRHIEYISSADVAYDTALEYAATCSFGFFRVLTRYADDNSFDQDILIDTVPDPFTVYIDCDAKKADRSDMRWAFVEEWMSRDAFQERFGDKTEISQASFFDGVDNPVPDWVRSDAVRVTEYWVVEQETRTMLRLSTGETVFQDEIGPLPVGITIERSRTTHTPRVKQYLINGVEILEEHEWAGKWIPIIPVYGKEIVVEGKRKLISLIRHARDPQVLHNYYKTVEAETISLVPRPKWVGYVGQFKTKQADWQNANVSNVACLEADPLDVNGTPAALPRWETFEAPIQALSVAAVQSADDIKSATNIFDASLGARSNETSGIAIQRRQNESDVSNFHFIDNLSRAQKHCGQILIDLIPKIMDVEREVRIIGADEQERIVRVNSEYLDEKGAPKRHDLQIGKYDVTVATGPSYTTKRQEAFDLLTQISQAYPQLVEIGGDIIFRNSDIPGADELAERLKRRLPPGLVDDQQGQPQLPPEVQQQLQQMGQVIEQLQAELDQSKSGALVKRMEIDSRERIAAMQQQTELIKTEAQLQSREAVELLHAQLTELKERISALNTPEMPDEQTLLAA